MHIMNSLIHADIFFFVSTIALILISIGIIIIIVYIIKILRTVSEVSDKVKEESTEIIHDIHTLRGDIRREGFQARYIKSFFGRLFGRRAKKK
jgi:uncharacterized membrane protein